VIAPELRVLEDTAHTNSSTMAISNNKLKISIGIPGSLIPENFPSFVSIFLIHCLISK
jgi:hypothetical protein